MLTKNLFINTFLWFSNTDRNLFANSSTTSQWNRIGLSIFVLLTGIFAFISGSFFVRTLFSTYDEVTKTTQVSALGWIVSFFVGVLWMIFIINLDRMIISSRNKYMALLRLPLAIAIGLIIAIPFEVQLFKDRITKGLIVASKSENSQYIQRFQKVVESNEEEVKRLQQIIDEEKKQMTYWRSAMEAETIGRVQHGRTGVRGEGPAYREAKANFELHESFLDQAQNELIIIEAKIPELKENAYASYKKNRIEQTFDFASLYEAFSKLKQCPENKSLKNLALFITLLFILIEITPALMKLFSEKDSYDQLLTARSYMDEQAINALTNFYMAEILDKKHQILEKSNSELQPKNSINKIGNTLK